MDEPYYRPEQVAPGTWKILSAGDHSYLAAGEKEAVSIDTGDGAGRQEARPEREADLYVMEYAGKRIVYDRNLNLV